MLLPLLFGLAACGSTSDSAATTIPTTVISNSTVQVAATTTVPTFLNPASGEKEITCDNKAIGASFGEKLRLEKCTATWAFGDTDVDTDLKLVLQATNWYVHAYGIRIRVTEFFDSLCMVLTCRDVQYRSFSSVTDCGACAGSRSKRRTPPVDRTGPGPSYYVVAGASSPRPRFRLTPE